MKKKQIISIALGVLSTLTLIGSGIGIGYSIDRTNVNETTNDSYIHNLLGERVTQERVPLSQLVTNVPTGSEVPVMMLTDGYGELRDLSFYEETAIGVNAIYGISSDVRPDKSKPWFYEAKEELSGKELAAAYTSQDNRLNGEKVFVVPGFNHREAIKEYWDGNSNISDTRFVLLDNPATYEVYNNNGSVISSTILKNTLAIEFDVREAAFKAGVLSSTYLNLIGDKDPKVGIWGGQGIPPVLEYLIGFIEGVNYYNENFLESGSNKKVSFVKFNKKEDFTNSGFKPGGGRNKAEFLVDNGADIVLPVAAGQTKDLISTINASSRKEEIKIIGVDSDNSIAYKDDKDLFLTSIIKNLRDWTYYGYKRLALNKPTTEITEAFDTTTNSLSITRGYGTGASYLKYFKTDVEKETRESVLWKAIYDTTDKAIFDDANFPTWDEAYKRL